MFQKKMTECHPEEQGDEGSLVEILHGVYLEILHFTQNDNLSLVCFRKRY